MNRAALIASAYAVDWLIGDPESLPHPVRLIGNAIDAGEQALRRPERSNAYNFIAGMTLSVGLVVVTYKLTAAIIREADRMYPSLGTAIELALSSTCLATRNLDDEARAVLAALAHSDMPQARLRIARIVGRDTTSLDEQGISRALIETLAESASDGIIAPLFYLAIGGVPLAMAFKAVSTLDSMIGHCTERYLYFGKAAARLDDLANLIPARLTALLILATNPSTQTINIYRRDHNKHASPNAGHPESAIASTLQIQLGGPSTYDGEQHHAHLLNVGAPLPTRLHASRALRITRSVSILGAMIAIALAATRRNDR